MIRYDGLGLLRYEVFSNPGVWVVRVNAGLGNAEQVAGYFRPLLNSTARRRWCGIDASVYWRRQYEGAVLVWAASYTGPDGKNHSDGAQVPCARYGPALQEQIQAVVAQVRAIVQRFEDDHFQCHGCSIADTESQDGFFEQGSASNSVSTTDE